LFFFYHHADTWFLNALIIVILWGIEWGIIDSVSELIRQSELYQIPVDVDYLAVCKVEVSSACLLVTKLLLIVLCCMFRHFTNILKHIYLKITHILI